MAARDRFLALPDRLICNHILTKLSLKEVIRCSVVSRRWNRFWTMVPDLKLTDEFFSSIPLGNHGKKRKSTPIDSNNAVVESIIDNILLLRSEHIRTFEFHNVSRFCHKIRQWILSVASKGVTEMTLKKNYGYLEVPSALFYCDKLVFLKLEGFNFTRTPPSFAGFQCLETFIIFKVELNAEAFEMLVKLCPLLGTLRVLDCTVITNLKLESQSLETLHLLDLDIRSFSSITANCPQLTNLVIEEYHFPLTKLEVNCPKLEQLATNNSRILEEIPILKSVRKLVLWDTDDMNILRKFPNIEELCISRWDHLPKELGLKLSRLKKLHIFHSSAANIAVLSHLIRRTPSLETVTISLGDRYSVKDLQFVNGLLSFMSTMTKVLLSQPHETCGTCKGLGLYSPIFHFRDYDSD